MQLASWAGGTVGVSAGYLDAYWDGPAYGYDLDYFYGPPVIYGGWGPDQCRHCVAGRDANSFTC
jgi:hypothetical protein